MMVCTDYRSSISRLLSTTAASMKGLNCVSFFHSSGMSPRPGSLGFSQVGQRKYRILNFAYVFSSPQSTSKTHFTISSRYLIMGPNLSNFSYLYRFPIPCKLFFHHVSSTINRIYRVILRELNTYENCNL